MLRKKELYTVITPIPSFIPRQLAIDILHSHSEIITLNPLVLGHKAIPAPRNAAADEYYSTWYEITERVQVIPGAGKFGSSKIQFNGCFHDMPWGVQTHIYAPMGIETRNRFRVGGNQPGEPPEHPEIGLEELGVPKDGLYLREDIEIRCNISLVSFVKSQNKAASKEMVNRIIKKAELLDAGVLQAMMSQDGRIQTVNPNDRSNRNAHLLERYNMQSPGSPRPMSYGSAASPPQTQFARPATGASYGYPNSPGQFQPLTPPPIPPKEEHSSPQPMELPGDYQFYNVPDQKQQQQHRTSQPAPSPNLHPDHAAPHHYPPQYSPASSDGRWSSTDHQRSSVGSTPGYGQPSPGYAPASELPSHR